MRLQILYDGYRPIQKLIMRFLLGGTPPGPVAVMSYRRNLFGKHLSNSFQEAMRRRTSWDKGEAELFAAFVSHLQQCLF